MDEWESRARYDHEKTKAQLRRRDLTSEEQSNLERREVRLFDQLPENAQAARRRQEEWERGNARGYWW